MIRELKSVLSRSDDLAQDFVGGLALVVMLLGSLYLPSLV